MGDASVWNKKYGPPPQDYADFLHMYLYQVLLVFCIHAVTEDVFSIGSKTSDFVVFLAKSRLSSFSSSFRMCTHFENSTILYF